MDLYRRYDLGIRVAGSPAARADQDRPESRRQVVAEDI